MCVFGCTCKHGLTAFLVLRILALSLSIIARSSLQIKMHLMDPFQERQRGQAREPKWKDMMQQLEAEVAAFGGWTVVFSVKVEGKNAQAEFEDALDRA